MKPQVIIGVPTMAIHIEGNHKTTNMEHIV
jgi:hypothetical protein